VCLNLDAGCDKHTHIQTAQSGWCIGIIWLRVSVSVLQRCYDVVMLCVMCYVTFDLRWHVQQLHLPRVFELRSRVRQVQPNKGVGRVLQECYKSFTRVLQECNKRVFELRRRI
jgi:hypothetical protein